MNTVLVWFSALSFLGFGTACFFAPSLQREFRRYGLSAWRPLVGVLQLAGATGLLAGFLVPLIGQAASAGLALLMLLGVGVRIRIHDTFLQALPALCYMALNAYLFATAF